MTSRQNESAAESSPQSSHPRRPWLACLCLTALVATAIVMPMCFLGNASGHDFQPHLASWIEAAGQWRQGILYPRWAEWANSGFGEPRFVFYPPASWMLGAALGSVLPWRMAPGIFVWLTLFVAGMSMWKLAREWLSPTQAVAAALFYTANPYHLALVYYRSDFAELLASAFFPLMLSGVCGVLRRGWRSVPLLAIAFAGIWLSNAPAGVIATYSLALLLLVGCVVARSVRPLIFGALGMLAGFGVAAFYLVPAWWEQRWVQIAQAVTTTYNPESNFLFTRVNDPDFIQFNWKMSALALGVIVLTSLGIALSFKQRRQWFKVWWMLFVLAFACVILMLPPSALLWRHLPNLRFLQFPWRWLLVLNLAFAFFAAAAGIRTRRLVWWVTLMCAIFATGATIAGDTAWDSADVGAVIEDVRAGRGYEGIEGFQPRGASVDELDDEAPLVAEFDPESGDIDQPESAQIKIQNWSAETKAFDATNEEAVTLGLKLLNYPAWQVQVDGQSVVADTAPQTGQMLVSLGPGSHHVEVRFRRSRDITAGNLISVVFAAGLLTLTIFARRRHRTEKSEEKSA